MMKAIFGHWVVWVLLISGVGLSAEPSEAELRDAWSHVYLEAAKDLELASSDGQPIVLDERPLLRWHNPVREGETHGDFFAWYRDGQPVVVGTLFSYVQPVGGDVRVAAMGLHPLVKENIGYRFRLMSGVISGVQLGQFDVEVERVAAAVDTPATRLAQLRSLSRQCEAWTVNDGVEHPLRLLPQPLLRRDAGSTGTPTDAATETASTSALFAMVTGTDPELLILIRSATPATTGVSRWQITPARFSDLPLRLSVQGKSAWRWHRASNQDPYVSRHQIFTMPLDPR